MRRFFVFAAVAFGTTALSASACSSSSVDDDTCAFIADPGNCYRRLVAEIDACLTDASNADGGVSPSGTLSADGLTCSYPTGRMVTFGSDARQLGGGDATTDVTVALGGKTCVHYVSVPKKSIRVTGPDGRTLSVEVSGSGETITCPDGSEHGIDAQKLFGGCGDAGGVLSGAIPGTVTSSSNKSVTGSLIGMKSSAYACTGP